METQLKEIGHLKELPQDILGISWAEWRKKIVSYIKLSNKPTLQEHLKLLELHTAEGICIFTTLQVHVIYTRAHVRVCVRARVYGHTHTYTICNYEIPLIVNGTDMQV